MYWKEDSGQSPHTWRGKRVLGRAARCRFRAVQYTTKSKVSLSLLNTCVSFLLLDKYTYVVYYFRDTILLIFFYHLKGESEEGHEVHLFELVLMIGWFITLQHSQIKTQCSIFRWGHVMWATTVPKNKYVASNLGIQNCFSQRVKFHLSVEFRVLSVQA